MGKQVPAVHGHWWVSSMHSFVAHLFVMLAVQILPSEVLSNSSRPP